MDDISVVVISAKFGVWDIDTLYSVINTRVGVGWGLNHPKIINYHFLGSNSGNYFVGMYMELRFVVLFFFYLMHLTPSSCQITLVHI